MSSALARPDSETIRAARDALADGDAHRCGQFAAAALQRDPASAEGHFLLAMALAESGRIALALQSSERAVALSREASPPASPAMAEYLAHHARLLTLARQEAQARAAADAALASAGEDPLVLDTIGCVYARLSDHAAALPLFERAVAGDPSNMSFRYNLASTYGFFGRVADAEIHYEELLKANPEDGRAHLGLATLRRQTATGNHVARLETALQRANDPVDRLRIHYAAAKEYEDLGDHAATYRHLSTGNRAHKARLGYTIESDEATVAAIETAFARPDYFSGDSGVADAPIFVIGLPRTGTTLVDRIISSHPQIQSAGELQAMPLAVKRLSQSPSRLVLDPDTIEAMHDVAPQDVGIAYVQRARQHGGAQAPVFTDKFPLNFLYVGFIARALPEARIVCLRRHPMDSVWSTYKTLFATGSPYYRWSYDLMDTAHYYLLFDRLMAFWARQFPGRVLELGYEALIADQEAETRRLIAHCGLSWSDACLAFHKNTAAVATPSAQQVRQPLNADSVGKWRAYADRLDDVTRLFGKNGISLD
ncbi:tetratricopeptide repeat-containing sulfotransferase family protein [Sphingobium algorifonticola]|uniref:tetratricopeptide repeat-containing sulfotransferase family protein n=1 Tax=Sphingobium algorifonticola TaxID=2008318 RepID=UPI001F4943D4|nr:sulfotransferase [Sphingobium algorifonticola]